MALVDVKELLDAGVHYGHRASRWNPKMRPTIDREEIHERKQFEETCVANAPALHNRIADQLPQTVIDMPMSKSNFRTKPR